MAQPRIAGEAEPKRDISDRASKSLERDLAQPLDTVITVCDQAIEACAVFFRAMERQRCASLILARR